MPAPVLIPVRRLFTGTPLSREHERALDRGESRRHKPVPWHRFDRSKYTEPALELAYDTNRKLAAGEYGAVAVFGQLTSALAMNGAPFDLVASAARTASDEMRHAEFALRMANLCHGREIGVRVDRGIIESARCRPSNIEELDRLMTEVPVMGETTASAMLMASRNRATDPVARAMIASLLADEVHHARLGWYYLHWRAPQWSRAEKQRVSDYAAGLVASSEWRFWTGRDAPRGSRAAAKALGVLDSESQRAALRRVMEDEIVPALDALGLGASHAWRARRRGGT